MNSSGPGNEAVTFESAFLRLEELVANLEDGGLTLEEMVQNFGEGMALVKQCYAKLDNAQLRVSTLLGEVEAERSDLFGEQLDVADNESVTDN